MELTNISPEELTAMLAAVSYVYLKDLEEEVMEYLFNSTNMEQGESFPDKFDEVHFEDAMDKLENKAVMESIVDVPDDFEEFDDTYSCGCCMCCGCTCDDYMWEDDGSFDDDDWGDDD